MVADPTQAAVFANTETILPAPASDQADVPPAPRSKYRLRFRKGGDLRLVSHHDLMHCVERMLRRASLPVAHTQGFHPQPRMVFALSLALGITGSNEVLELELTQPLPAEELHARLAQQAPPGIDILSVALHPCKAACQVRRAFYRLPLQAAPPPPADAEVAERCAHLLAQPHVWVERQRSQPRRLNIRPYLSELHVHDRHLEMTLWVTPNGTARPEEIVRLLELGRLLDDGAFLERTHLELMDEVPADAVPLPVVEEKEAEISAAAPPSKPSETKQNSRPTALISGPLSFDS